MHCEYFDTTQKANHSNFLTATVVGGRRSLLSNICAQGAFHKPTRDMRYLELRIIYYYYLEPEINVSFCLGPIVQW